MTQPTKIKTTQSYTDTYTYTVCHRNPETGILSNPQRVTHHTLNETLEGLIGETEQILVYRTPDKRAIIYQASLNDAGFPEWAKIWKNW